MIFLKGIASFQPKKTGPACWMLFASAASAPIPRIPAKRAKALEELVLPY